MDTGYEIFWIQQSSVSTKNIKTLDNILTSLIDAKQKKMVDLLKYIFDNTVNKLTE